MGSSARRRANMQAQAYWPEVLAALKSDAPAYDDGRLFKAINCDYCGRLLTGCGHAVPRRP